MTASKIYCPHQREFVKRGRVPLLAALATTRHSTHTNPHTHMHTHSPHTHTHTPTLHTCTCMNTHTLCDNVSLGKHHMQSMAYQSRTQDHNILDSLLIVGMIIVPPTSHNKQPNLSHHTHTVLLGKIILIEGSEADWS